MLRLPLNEVDHHGDRSDNEQDVQGKRGDMKKQKSADPQQDKKNRERQPHKLVHLAESISSYEQSF